MFVCYCILVVGIDTQFLIFGNSSLEWTVALTKYLQNCATKLCSKSKSVSELLLLLKPANEESSVGDQGNMGDSMDTSEDHTSGEIL